MENKPSMNVKHQGIAHFYFPDLGDWEILSAVSYCNRAIEGKTLKDREEFLDISFFFFDGNEKLAEQALHEVKRLYTVEYTNRRIN